MVASQKTEPQNRDTGFGGSGGGNHSLKRGQDAALYGFVKERKGKDAVSELGSQAGKAVPEQLACGSQQGDKIKRGEETKERRAWGEGGA